MANESKYKIIVLPFISEEAGEIEDADLYCEGCGVPLKPEEGFNLESLGEAMVVCRFCAED